MAEEVAALQVRLEATQARFERDMQRASRSMNRVAGRMERRARRLNRTLGDVGRGFGLQITSGAAASTAAIVGIGAAVRSVVRSGDLLIRLEGRFTALTGSATRAEAKIADIFRIASSTGADFEGVANAMQRFTIAAQDLGSTDAEVAQLVETIVKIGQIGGSSTAELNAGLLQLGQALASGRLQGDELRSVLESIPLIGDIIAKEFGVARGALFDLGSEGELTADRVLKALVGAADDVEKRFQDLPVTVDRASNELATSWTRFTAAIDDSIGASETLVDVLQGAAELLDDITGTMSTLPGGVQAAGAISDLVIAAADADAAARRPRPARPSRSRGRGGSRVARAPQDQFPGELARANDQIRLLQEEAQLIGLTRVEADLLSASFEAQALARDLLTAAQEDGTAATEEERAAAEALADRYQRLAEANIMARDAAREAAEAQREFDQSLEDFTGTAQEAILGLIDGTLDWKQALTQVLDVLLDIARQGLQNDSRGGNSLFDVLSGAITSAFGGVNLGADPLPGITGRASGGPVRAGVPYVVGEKRPELFVPNQSGRIVPRVRDMPGGSRGGAPISIGPTTINITEPGASAEQIQAIVARSQQETVRRIIDMNRRDPTVLQT